MNNTKIIIIHITASMTIAVSNRVEYRIMNDLKIILDRDDPFFNHKVALYEHY